MKVVISDNIFPNQDPERGALGPGTELVVFNQYPGPEAFLRAARDADAILANQARMDSAIIGALERCRVIVRYGVGVDNVDVAAATRRGIPVCNVPDYCTDDVADHTVTIALALVRKLPASIEYLRGGGWGQEPLRPIRRLSALTFGICGFGRIAQAVAQRARGFGFRMIAHDPYVPDAAFEAAGAERVDADRLLAERDLLSLHMPLTESTRGLVGRESLPRMKRGVLLVNTARGGLVDTQALLEALDSGQVGGAALDVLDPEPIPADHPLWQRPNVFLTPHFAWYSEEALTQLQRSVGEEAARVLRGEPPRCVVNKEYAAHR